MANKLKISKILAWIAFAIYVLSLFLPYTQYRDYKGTAISYISSRPGIEEGYFLFLFFIIPALVFTLVRHTNVAKAIALTAVILLFGTMAFIARVGFVGDYARPHIGFYMLVLCSILLLVSSIIKMTVPAEPDKRKMSNNVLDQF